MAAVTTSFTPTTCDPLDPLCGSWFNPISWDAFWLTVIAWVVGSLLIAFSNTLIWFWVGGLKFGARDSVPAEKVHLIAYLDFWIVIAVGMMLTSYTDLDVMNTPLVRVFGYNNVCVNFDFAPSSYALPYIYAVTLIFLILFQIVQYLSLRAHYQAGRLGQCMYQFLSKSLFFTSFTLIFFSTIFAVNPKLEDEDPDHITLILHTLPFSVLQVGVTVQAVNIALQHYSIDYWSLLGLNGTVGNICQIVNIVASIIVITFKIIVAWNAMLGKPWFDQPWIVNSGLAEAFDQAFLFLAAGLPCVYNALLIAFKYDQLPKINIAVTTIESFSAKAEDRCADCEYC